VSRKRKFTDDECKGLAAWFKSLRSLGSVRGKARELKVSPGALMDAIARGDGRERYTQRQKLRAYELEQLVDEIASRGTEHSG
jgi:hypothetical protein